ncbi:hypothetical protein PENTCL1PPCAC_29153, partial [Pristionchus entomophagus]
QSTKLWNGYCTTRGFISPEASWFKAGCDSDNVPKKREVFDELPMPNLKCDQCLRIGTDRCDTTPEGQPDICVCKMGWSGLTCWRYPRFCPNMTCPTDSTCEERVDHAVCVCQTDKCIMEARALNRSPEMKILDKTVHWAGPGFQFFFRLLITVLFPERGRTVQDSIQYMRATWICVAAVIYVLSSIPETLDMEIAERRIFSILFHIPQLLVHIYFALEVYHCDSVRRGKSDNNWSRWAKDRTYRWDYARTHGTIIILGVLAACTIWYLNWNSQQREYTSMGVVDANGGMLIWTMVAYFFCTLMSLEILMNPNRRKLETVRRDNKYECCDKPKLQEYEDACWRNVVMCLIGAPIQCAYSMTMVAVLAYDQKELKYINITLAFLNSMAGFMQAVQCDRKTLGKMESLSFLTLRSKDLRTAIGWNMTCSTSVRVGIESPLIFSSLSRQRLDQQQTTRAEEEEDYPISLLGRAYIEAGLPHSPL